MYVIFKGWQLIAQAILSKTKFSQVGIRAPIYGREKTLTVLVVSRAIHDQR